MIVKEFYKQREDGVNLFKTYSDKDYYIRKIGTDEIYEEAIDVENTPYEYEETDQKIEVEIDTEIQPSNMEVIYKGKPA